jgi:hypothetical protein
MHVTQSDDKASAGLGFHRELQDSRVRVQHQHLASACSCSASRQQGQSDYAADPVDVRRAMSAVRRLGVERLTLDPPCTVPHARTCQAGRMHVTGEYFKLS